MSSRPYMKLWCGDYLGDTGHLTLEQHGAYLLLLFRMWRAGGFLPNDETKLARYLGVSVKVWRRLAPDIMPFFTIGDGIITQKRLSLELQKADAISAVRSRAARTKLLNYDSAAQNATARKANSETKHMKTNKPPSANALQTDYGYQQGKPISRNKKDKSREDRLLFWKDHIQAMQSELRNCDGDPARRARVEEGIAMAREAMRSELEKEKLPS